jgi:hypothetical protein
MGAISAWAAKSSQPAKQKKKDQQIAFNIQRKMNYENEMKMNDENEMKMNDEK